MCILSNGLKLVPPCRILGKMLEKSFATSSWDTNKENSLGSTASANGKCATLSSLKRTGMLLANKQSNVDLRVGVCPADCTQNQARLVL